MYNLRGACKWLCGILAFVAFLGAPTGHAQSTVDLPAVKEIPGAVLPESVGLDMEQAEQLAIQAYLDKMGGIRATEAFGRPAILLLGFAVNGFAQEGDKVWEVRVSGMNANNSQRTLRAILWVHPDTGKVHFLCGPLE